MPLPIDFLIIQIEKEILILGPQLSEPEVHQLEKVLEWAKEQKAVREKINSERWNGVEPIPEDMLVFRDPNNAHTKVLDILIGHVDYEQERLQQITIEIVAALKGS